jgi:hypothetical protein
MALCASCKSKVEDGAVECGNCGAKLDLPGSFLQVVGWVIIACSSIPFGISLVTTAEKDFVPLGIACGVLGTGVVLNLMGKFRSKSVSPTVIDETSSVNPAN